MIGLVLLGCSPGSLPETDATLASVPSGPPAAAVVDALEVLLSDVMDMHALPAVEAYESLTTSMEATCPDRFEEPGSVHWSGRCTTTNGVTYAGAAFWTNFAVAGLPEERWGGVTEMLLPDVAVTGREFFGQIDIIHPDLGDFRCSGSAAVLASDDGRQRVEVSRTEGDCAFSSAPADSWLSGAPRPSFLLLRQWRDGVLFDARIQGSIAGLEGEISALKLHLGANTEDDEYACKVSGWAMGRDEAGGWTTVEVATAGEGDCEAIAETDEEGTLTFPFEPMAASEPWPW